MSVLNDVQLGKSIRDNPISPVYFLYGKEVFLSEKYLNKLIRKVVAKGTESFNFQKIDGATLNMTALEVEAEAMPLMEERKCLAVMNPNIEKMAKADFDTLISMVSDPNPTTVLIVYVSAFELNPKKNARVKKFSEEAAKTGVVVEFSPKTNSELIKAIKQRVAKAGATIETPAASYLIQRCGNSLDSLANEVDKLTGFRPEGEITKKDIESIAGVSLEASVFDLSKALMQSNYNKAFSILNELLIERQEPLAILAVLNMTFVDLYRAKTAMLASKTVQDVCEAFPYKGKE
ncbi:MAG: DNA polymerase III subunit delta, partial [Oscillospiraceae bacterium]